MPVSLAYRAEDAVIAAVVVGHADLDASGVAFVSAAKHVEASVRRDGHIVGVVETPAFHSGNAQGVAVAEETNLRTGGSSSHVYSLWKSGVAANSSTSSETF